MTNNTDHQATEKIWKIETTDLRVISSWKILKPNGLANREFFETGVRIQAKLINTWDRETDETVDSYTHRNIRTIKHTYSINTMNQKQNMVLKFDKQHT